VPISLTLKEKCYLIALFGDIPAASRERLFRWGSFPPQAGPLVMQAGYDLVGELNNGRILYRRKQHPLL
jgi:hypothetical protein